MNQNIGQQGSLVNDTCSASSDSDAFRFWRTDLGLSFLRLLFRTSAWVRSSSDFSDDPTPVGSSEEGSGGRHLYALLLIYRMIQMITIRRRKMQKTTQLIKSSTYPSLFSRIVLFEDVLGDERSFIHINKYSTHPIEDLYPRQLLR